MKKILLSLTILFSTLLFTTKAYASSLNINIVGNDTFENKITLYIQVNKLEDFNGACKGLCGLVGNLEYDKNKIELTSIKALSGFDLTEGKKIVLYKSTGVSSGTKVLELKFKNKSLSINETTTIKFSNIVASDGDKDISTTNVSKKIKLVEKESDINDQPEIETEPEIKESNNNYLSEIKISKGIINFNKEVLTYDIIVDYQTKNIIIEAFSEDEKAKIFGPGKYSLNLGNNTVKIKVIAEDESERTYTLNINREEDGVIVDYENILIKEEENNNLIKIIIISSVILLGIVGLIIYKKNSM